MNLFCFTLGSSTESIYEPASSATLKDVLPQYQCSLVRLRPRAEWCGSDPSIHTDQHQRTTELRGESRRSCVTLALETEALKKDNQACWTSYGDEKEVHHQMTVKSGPSFQSGTGGITVKELSSDRIPTHSPAQSEETAAEASQTRGRLKKLQKLVHVKKGHQSDGDDNYCLSEVVKSNMMLTCISMSRRTEMSSLKTTQSPQQLLQPNTRDLHGDPVDTGVWSPKSGGCLWKQSDCPQAWPPSYHTCQKSPHKPWACSGSSSLRRNADWDHFESLIQELDKQLDLSLLQMTRSITDLQQNINKDSQRDEAEKRKASHQRTLSKRHQKSRNSMESSSSGVTSGSDCSNNRESLRLEEDPSFTKQFCCRATVHTEYVPSPYDTDSLQLKVGDVIDVIAKPPLGTWTGMLNGQIGTFKFIYVDVLSSEPSMHEVRHGSTVQEVLKHLSLEAYSSSLQLSGYQTFDLMKLREHDVMELNMTDPKDLLTANSLQQLHSDNHVENRASQELQDSGEDMKAELKTGPRDLGCLMTSDSPENCKDLDWLT